MEIQQPFTQSSSTITGSGTTGQVAYFTGTHTISSISGATTDGTSMTFGATPTFSTMTAGSVFFAGTSGLLSQDNGNLFYDSTNHTLIVGGTTSAGLGNKIHMPVAPMATANYGTLSMGGGSWTGAGRFAGSSSGTSFAINEVSGYAGNLADWQVNGVSQFKVTGVGAVIGGNSSSFGSSSSLGLNSTIGSSSQFIKVISNVFNTELTFNDGASSTNIVMGTGSQVTGDFALNLPHAFGSAAQGTIVQSDGSTYSQLMYPLGTDLRHYNAFGFRATASFGNQIYGKTSIGPTLTANPWVGFTPTAWITLTAGSATTGNAPLKFTSGTNLTTPEAGAKEYDGTLFYQTNSNAVRQNIWSGVPARLTAQTAAASLTAYTVGAADGSFIVSSNVNMTTATLCSFSVVCTYTDETNTSRALTLNFSQISGTLVQTLTNALGAGAYEGVPLHIRAKAGTTITIASTGTFTTVTYNIERMISQIA